MAINSWQVCSAYLLVLGFLSVTVRGSEPENYVNKLQRSRVSKPTTRVVPHDLRSFESASSYLIPTQLNYYPSNFGFAARDMQPSVYHSIIDRTTPSKQIASPIQATTSTVADLNTAAGHHHGHAHGKYYEYREVPKKKTWKYGYKRGNHKHTIERHEHGKAGKHPHFKTKVKWHDKKSKGKGIHLWDYNHHDKKHYHHG